MDAEDQSRFGPLTDSEKDMFLNVGPGSPSSCRWLQAVLFSISRYGILWKPRLGCRPFHMDDRHDREFIISDDYRHLASSVLAHVEWKSQKYIHDWGSESTIGRMEPMTAYSADTLIRFSLTRHDATDMLCSSLIGDPVGAMMRSITDTPRSRTTSNGIISHDEIFMYMIQHMALPVATHPFSPLQDIVNAVCYGTHGNGRIDQSGIGGHGPDIMAPLSGTMEYQGRPCSPRLMAHMLSGNELYAVIDNDTTMVVSMPGVETMNLFDAVTELSGSLRFMGNLRPFSSAGSPGPEWRLPVTDYGTMMGAIGSGRYEETVPCINATDRIPDLASGLYVEAMADAERPDGLPEKDDPDRLPDTYAAMVERARRRSMGLWDEKDYAIMPDMADISYALTFERPESTDWTLFHDLMVATFSREKTMPADEMITIPGSGAWSVFARTLPLRDPIISDAAMRLTRMMAELAKRLISVSREKPDSVGVMLIPSHALALFFTDMHQGAPYDFALQTLISRSSIGFDRERDPGFHGLVLIMPHMFRNADDGDGDAGDRVGFAPMPVDADDRLPIAGTIDFGGENHPDVIMIP